MNTTTQGHSKSAAFNQFFEDVRMRLAYVSNLNTRRTTCEDQTRNGQLPHLWVHVGPTDPCILRSVRSALPDHIFLLWLCPEGPASVVKAMEHAVEAADLTWIGSLSDETLSLAKISFLVELIPEGSVRLDVDESLKTVCASQIQEIQRTIKVGLHNREQDRSRGLVRLRSSLYNLPSILVNQGTSLNRVEASLSAIICGAGPSLSSQFGQLRELQHKAVLISTGHAVPSLLEAGITPHIVVEVDTYAQRNWPATRTKSRFPGILVACTEVAPAVADRFDQVFWCLGSSPTFNHALTQWGLQLQHLQLGKTVSVPAMDIALRWGFSRMALVGQDLCLSSTGETHVDHQKQSGDDQTVHLPGNTEESVVANQSFVELRETIQRYLVFIQRKFMDSIRITNCTAGGAAIEGAVWQSLEQWSQSLTPLPRDLQLTRHDLPNRFNLEHALVEVDRFLDNYVKATEEIQICGQKLGQALRLGPRAKGEVRDQQRALQNRVAHEGQLRDQNRCSFWLHPLLKLADGLQRRGAPLDQENDPLIQLELLNEYYATVNALSLELKGDIRSALSINPRAERVSDTTPSDPLLFRSFKQVAVRRIQKSHPELAFWLQNRNCFDVSEFSVRWLNQHIPYVERKTSAGPPLALSSFLSMFDEAEEEVSRFIKHTSFQPEQDAIVFVGAGNWVYIKAFFDKFPNCLSVVLEPWVSLLGEMSLHGCFLHVLPDHACILGTNKQLKEWKGLLRKTLIGWKEARHRILIFGHPRAGADPEVQQLECFVRSLVERGIQPSSGVVPR